MSSYLPPTNDLPKFNPNNFKSSLTDEEIESKINTLESRTSLLIQSGKKTASVATGSITFDEEFDGAPSVATSINDGTTATRIVSVRVSNITSTGFNFKILKIEDSGGGLAITSSNAPFDYVAQGNRL